MEEVNFEKDIQGPSIDGLDISTMESRPKKVVDQMVSLKNPTISSKKIGSKGLLDSNLCKELMRGMKEEYPKRYDEYSLVNILFMTILKAKERLEKKT